MKGLNVSVERAAEIMGVSPMFLRLCLRDGDYSFGFAKKQKKDGNRYTYYINAKDFAEHVGKTIEEVLS